MLFDHNNTLKNDLKIENYREIQKTIKNNQNKNTTYLKCIVSKKLNYKYRTIYNFYG